jgi:NAD(P)-dependent dehydrogenase (short-subunit alcohol dehydrogenase family)
MVSIASNNPYDWISIASLALPKGEIYCATKHAVCVIRIHTQKSHTHLPPQILGLCRSLRDELEAYNIRVATVCPWFTDTNILKTDTRIALAGAAMTPIERVVGGILNAATDPDWTTNGATYTAPDDKEVFRISAQELSVGSYKLLHDRIKMAIK